MLTMQDAFHAMPPNCEYTSNKKETTSISITRAKLIITINRSKHTRSFGGSSSIGDLDMVRSEQYPLKQAVADDVDEYFFGNLGDWGIRTIKSSIK
jgi:hypothetical protein